MFRSIKRMLEIIWAFIIIIGSAAIIFTWMLILVALSLLPLILILGTIIFLSLKFLGAN